MSFLNSLIHGDALTEILLEGHNPYALRKLESADVDALRQALFTTEKLLALASGRVVGSGRGVWLLTDRALLLRDACKRGVQRVELEDVGHLEAERGRFGHTLRLQAQGRHWSLYGVDRGLAQRMHEALAGLGKSSQFDARTTRQWLWREPAPAGWAQDCLEDARRRLVLA